MKAKTLKALQGSIRKWERIAGEGKRKGSDNGWENCPLCTLFNSRNDCSGCPVAEKSGEAHCHNTPYEKWTDYHLHVNPPFHFPLNVFGAKSARLAKAELQFLRRLLPKEARKTTKAETP